MPPKGVLTPDALFTALLEKEPVTGMEWKKAPTVLHRPRVSISWVASRDWPRAEENQPIIILSTYPWHVDARNLQKDLAMATFPIIDIRGTIRIPVPKLPHMSRNVSVWLPTVLENGGGSTDGNPASMCPVRTNGAPPRLS